MFKLGTASIIFCKNKVLVGKRLSKNGNGLYCVPGGKIDPEDTSVILAAIREIKEETNLDIPLKDKFGEFVLSQFIYTDDLVDESGDKWITFYFTCDLKEYEILNMKSMEPHKCVWEWMPIDDVKLYKMWNNVGQIILDYDYQRFLTMDL